MPHYSQQDADRVFDRSMDEVHAYYRRLAEQQRPRTEQAIASLRGSTVE